MRQLLIVAMNEEAARTSGCVEFGRGSQIDLG